MLPSYFAASRSFKYPSLPRYVEEIGTQIYFLQVLSHAVLQYLYPHWPILNGNGVRCGDLGEGSGDDSRLSVAIPGSHMCPDVRDEEEKKTTQPNKNP